MRKFLRKTQKIGASTSALRNASKSSSSNSESSSPSSRDVSEERSGRSFYSENEKEIDRLKKRSLKDTARIRSTLPAKCLAGRATKTKSYCASLGKDNIYVHDKVKKRGTSNHPAEAQVAS